MQIKRWETGQVEKSSEVPAVGMQRPDKVERNEIQCFLWI